MVKAHRLLNIDRADYPRLGTLAPMFSVVAACTVILASLSKALFLASNPISLLPWMFLGAAAITAGTSLGYVALMRALGLSARFRLLLGVAVVSLLGLRLGYPASPALLGIVILLWCPAVGHLLVVQTWNVASSLLPTRQGKRMMPVLAAVTTLGAALGGLLVQLLLRWLEAEDLLAVAAVALLYPLVSVRAVVRSLGGEGPPSEPAASSVSGVAPSVPEESEIAAGFRSIRRRPLLADLALLSFLLQAASLVIDYQLSAEIKPQFDKDGIAAFLGTFYWTSNLVVLLLTLVATSRFVRLVGIGVALATSGIVVGAGSALYFFAASSGMLSMFWVIAATAFAERVASYAFSKPAVQMVYMPLQTRGGERAKTIIDGVFHRMATALVSVLLLVAAPELSTQFRLSLPAAVACCVVVYLGLRISPHYRRALFEALRTRRLDDDLARYLRDGLGGGAARELEARLRSSDPKDVLRALEVARELQLALTPSVLEELAEHDDDRIARGALQTMEALGERPTLELLTRVLAAHRPPALLRSILVLLSDRADAELAEIVRPLTQHEDAAVASAACVFRIRAAGAVDSFDAEVRGDTAAVRLTGMTRAGDFARELPELVRHPKTAVRHDAIEQMGELGLPMFLAPLIACLDTWDARGRSADALVRFGDRAVPMLADHARADDLGMPARIALLGVLERIGTDRAAKVLVNVCRGGATILKNHAVEALWRLGATSDRQAVSREELIELVESELALLQLLSGIELALVKEVPLAATLRGAMFVGEVGALSLASERRVFRLLGLLYDRAALQRALLHYRSSESRARSNAIELLEQHITDSSVHPFVGLIERQEDSRGNMRPRSMVVQGLDGVGEIGELVAKNAWLARLWSWVKERQRDPLAWTAPLDRLVVLQRIPMFAEASGELLLELAGAFERVRLDRGTSVFDRGSDGRDVYWLLDGELSLELQGGASLAVARRECFGEMGALDGRARPYRALAGTDVTLARLELSGFEDAVALFPSLLRRVIEILSRRLRARIQ